MAINLSGSLVLTGSITTTGGITISGSIASASFAGDTALFAGKPVTIFPTTGSNTFVGSQTITGSVLQSGSLSVNGCIVSTGQIVAQTINVQQVTSSVVYSCGSNTFGCSTSNTQVLTGSVYITGSNHIATVTYNCFGGMSIVGSCLGIGTNTPSDKLEVNGAILSTANTVLSTTKGAIFDFNDSQDAGRILAYKSTGANLLFYTNASGGSLTERLRITSTGIACFACQVCANSTGGISGTFRSSTFFGSIDLENTGGDVAGKWNVQSVSGAQIGGSAGSSFGIYSYGASAYRLFINSSGNVGIGTTSPNATLSINACRVLATVSGQACISSGVNDIGCIFFGLGDANSNQRSGMFGYQCWNGTYTDYLLKFQITKGGVGSIDAITISCNGNVGIGASINPVYNLEVSSTGGSQRIRVGTLQNNDNTPRFEAITSNGVSVANSAWLKVNDAGGFTLGQSDYTKAGGDSGNFSCLSSEVEYPRIFVSSAGNVGMGTTSTSTEANLFLGNQGSGAANEGGQLVLQKAYSCSCATHLDNYADSFRVLVGTDTSSNGVHFLVDHKTRNACFYGYTISPKYILNGTNVNGAGYAVCTFLLSAHIESTTQNILTLGDINAYTTAVAHIDWTENYALAGNNMTIGYTIAGTRRGSSNTVWVNSSCTLLSLGDAPTPPTFAWSNGSLQATAAGSHGINALFKITVWAATGTPNI